MRKLQFLILAFFMASSLPLMAADSNSDSSSGDNVTVVDGLRFNVPSDRPVEKTPYGLVQPMPLDQYVAMKISNVEKSLQDMRKALEKTEGDVAAMKEDIGLLKKNLPNKGATGNGVLASD